MFLLFLFIHCQLYDDDALKMKNSHHFMNAYYEKHFPSLLINPYNGPMKRVLVPLYTKTKWTFRDVKRGFRAS